MALFCDHRRIDTSPLKVFNRKSPGPPPFSAPRKLRRLLVFSVDQGWEPLCKFLDVPVPSTPYPLTNTTEEFRARATAMPPPTSGR